MIKYINVAVDDAAAAIVASAASAAVDFVLFEIISMFVLFLNSICFNRRSTNLCMSSARMHLCFGCCLPFFIPNSMCTYSFIHSFVRPSVHLILWILIQMVGSFSCLHCCTIFIDMFLNRLGTNRARIKMHTNREKKHLVSWCERIIHTVWWSRLSWALAFSVLRFLFVLSHSHSVLIFRFSLLAACLLIDASFVRSFIFPKDTPLILLHHTST